MLNNEFYNNTTNNSIGNNNSNASVGLGNKAGIPMRLDLDQDINLKS